jgi:hypothetical protein
MAGHLPSKIVGQHKGPLHTPCASSCVNTHARLTSRQLWDSSAHHFASAPSLSHSPKNTELHHVPHLQRSWLRASKGLQVPACTPLPLHTLEVTLWVAPGPGNRSIELGGSKPPLPLSPTPLQPHICLTCSCIVSITCIAPGLQRPRVCRCGRAAGC